MGANEDLLQRRAAVVARGVPMVTPTAIASGHGAILLDHEGREYIDFAGGIGVMSLGHTDAAVVRAVSEQAARLQHTCIHVATYEPYVALCERLVDLFPHGGPGNTKALLLNSGAEAVENAVKIARQATGRPAVICFTEAFHGRTLLASTMTSKVGYKLHCGPFAPEVYRLEYPNHFRRGFGMDVEAFAQRELDRLRTALLTTVAADSVAAIVLELVQGEGGFAMAPTSYLQGLREICDEHGIVLVFDEVQTGFCRTGAWGAYQRLGVEPDLSTWAKAMGGGLPISAVVGRAEVMDGAVPGTLGGTYGGNPVACASALATIDRMQELDLNARADAIGASIRAAFEGLRHDVPAAADVRGLGAMIALELCHDGDPGKPAGPVVRAVVDGCAERGLLVVPAGVHGNVLRILCPLTIDDETLERGLGILTDEIRQHAGAAVAAGVSS